MRKPTEVEISFGTVFRKKSSQGRLTKKACVIIDVDEGNSFECWAVSRSKGAYQLNGFPGSGGPEYFGKAIGHLTLEEVLDAARRFF